MNSKERINALLKGEKIDRIPSAPLIFNHGARLINIPISEFNQNAELMAKANIAAYKRYGNDLSIVFSTTSTLAEAMGSKLKFPHDDAPYVDVPIVQKPEDIDLVKIPNPYEDGRLPVYLGAAKILKEEIGEEVHVAAVFAGPFTNGSHLRGTEAFILDTYKNKELVKKLLELSVQAGKVFIDELVKLNVIPVMVEPVASGNLISAKQFKEFSQPYLTELIEYAHSKGSPIVLHICGKTQKIIELMAEANPDVISIDTIDIGLVKEKIGDKVVILGNVDPAVTLLKGTPNDVKEAVKNIIEKAGDSPKGLIVSSGCEVPINSPFENVEALIEATKEYGQL